MLAQNLAIWALMTLGLLSWVDNYFAKKEQFVMELDANLNAQVDADLNAIGNPVEVVLLTFHEEGYRMAPTWDDLTKDLEEELGVSISMIDCTEYRGPCQAFAVIGISPDDLDQGQQED